MEFIEENWKKLVKQHLIELKKQIENIRLNYINNNSRETIDGRLIYKNQEDDEWNECEPVGNDDDVTDSDEDSRDSIRVVCKSRKSDTFTDLYQHMKNLEIKFLNEDENKIINDEIYQNFSHLLLRIFHKIKMYFIDYDIYSGNFYDDIVYVKNIFIKREKQLQRLFYSKILSKYDSQMIEYETTLQKRANKFNLYTNGEQNFDTLKTNHLDIFDFYNRQCIHFHSTLTIRGLYGNIDDFTKRFLEQKIDINDKQRKALEQAFNYFDIPLDNPQIICRKDPYTKQNQSTYFLPSQDIRNSTIQEKKDINYIDLIKSIRDNRWVVLLGGAGSGKTTFARWLISQFARALFIEQKNIIIHGIDMGPARIPILIRIGEFAQWLESHPESTLLDYIGEHTWFGQLYVSNRLEILKDFVRYGHALIIFDGLDEVATLELHNRIVTLMRFFIQSYCMSNECVSPFDDAYTANAGLRNNFRREGLSGKNLVLITSRIISYTSHPFNSELISHYTIQLMSMEYLRTFVENWCFYVQHETNHLLIKIIPDLKENKIKFHSNIKPKILISKIESDNRLTSLASNISVLSIICMLFARYGSDALEKTRVQLYQKVVELMLQRWENHQSNIHEDALRLIFSNMAFYIHSHSGSGLIDEFDLTSLCRLSLMQWYNKQTSPVHYDSLKIRQQTEQFIQLLSEDSGIVAARALCVYGFLHLTFQEYFVCLALVNNDNSSVEINIKELVNRLLSLFSNPRLRESLNLVLGWISLYWSTENYDKFCIELQSKTNLANKYLPLGSLWFSSALYDLARLPSVSIVYNILNALLDIHAHEDVQTYIFKNELVTALNRLPIDLVNNWFDRLFSEESPTITLKMVHILYEEVSCKLETPHWFTQITCGILWKQMGLLNEEIDIYIDRILTIIGAINSDCLPTPSGGMREYFLSHMILTSEIHSSVLAAIIVLYGGLERNQSKTKREISVVFSARRMHRDSPLTSLFIEYMEDTITEREAKLKHLTDKCEQILATATSTNITTQITHSLVILFCIYGINRSSSYEQYMGSAVWQQAVRHMKVILLYLRELFCIRPWCKFKNNLTDILKDFSTNSQTDILDFAQSISHAYCRLLCTRTSSLVPDAHMDGWAKIIIIKMPPTVELSNITNMNDNKLIKLLSFICYAGSTIYRTEIEEIEAEDLNLLRKCIHPFQLLQNKPLTLLLAYVPSYIQSLYIQLLAQNQISTDETSILPFLHLLIEFLCATLLMEECSIRFCVLLVVVLPTIVQFKMENFVPMFVSASRLKAFKNSSKVYEDSCFEDFVRVMKVTGYNERKLFEKEAMIEEQGRIINAQTDLQLYAACCCLARLAESYYTSTREYEILQNKFDELWSAAQAIKHPVWRFDATINICCIMFPNQKDKEMKIQLKDRYVNLMTSLKELQPNIPLLTYVALFVRCMTFIHEDFQLEKELIDNILQRLKTVTIDEQQAICETFITFPRFRHIICQHVRKSQHLEKAVKLNQIFQHTSIIFSKNLSTKFYLTSDMMGIHPTLLVSMYLSELSLYVKFLDDSQIKEKHQYTRDSLIPQSLAQKCLKTLEEEPVKFLTVESASMICSLLSSPIQETERIHVLRIYQSLVKKTHLQESAYLFVLKWLHYRDDKRLHLFAYHSALLLGLSNMWTSTIIEICCELLANEWDHFRDIAIKLIRNGGWRSEKESVNIFINCLDHWNKKQSKWLSEIEYLFRTLDIQSIDEIEQILQLERDRFHRNIESKSSTSNSMNNYHYEVSFFRLIKTLSSEVREYIVTLMRSFSECLSNLAELFFLQWLLEHISCELFKDDESFIEILIGFLLDSHYTTIKVAAARNLIFFQENKLIQTVLWNIVINNEQEDSNEYVDACMWSLCVTRNDNRFAQEKLKELDHLREHARSSIMRQSALAAMYFHISTEPEKYHIIEVYYSYMMNTSYDVNFFYNNGSIDIASSWIIKHTSILLPQLIDDVYKNFDTTSFFNNLVYIRVAARVCKEIFKEFCDAVRQSLIGENAFRKGLYEMSRKVRAWDQMIFLYVYSCFEQITPDYVTMLTQSEAAFYTSGRFNYIERLQSVSERQSIESLFDALQSSLSLERRCVVAEVLVHLTILNQVSATDVQQLLTRAIEDPWTQQLISSQNQSRADWTLRRLLGDLLIQAPHRNESINNIDMVNDTLRDRVPAAFFQDKSNN